MLCQRTGTLIEVTAIGNAHGLATALTWFSDTIGLDLTLAPTDQVAMTKETLVLIAMLAAVASLMAVMELLLTTPFFSKAVQPLPGEASVKPNGAWWRGAIITMLLAAATYPFMAQLGHGLLPLPENIFRMTVGNGFLSWYLLLILIMLVTSIIGYQKNKKRGAQDGWQSMGLGTAAASGRMGWGLLGRCALLVLCMLAYPDLTYRPSAEGYSRASQWHPVACAQRRALERSSCKIRSASDCVQLLLPLAG